MTDHDDSGARTIRTRGKILIGLGVIALAAVAGYLVHQKAQDKPAAEAVDSTRRVVVVVTQAALRDFEQRLVVQGNVEAKRFAVVSPRVGGTLDAIFVDEGDSVTAGQTKLFQTDAVNLAQNLQISQNALTVAQCAKRQAAANLEKIGVDLNKAQLDYDRFKRLHEKQAVTDDAFEQQQSRYEQLAAARKLAVAQLELATAQEEQARCGLAIAQKDLADATVIAPISGKVSQRLKEPGEMGGSGEPVLRIDDPCVVEVAAFLPAQYYAAVTAGQTPMTLQISGVDLGRRTITYRSPTIHPKLRTFEVKTVVENPPDGVAPGALAQISVVLETRRGLGVPAASVQQRGGQSVVFVVSDNAARQVPVTTGIEADGWIEVRQGDLKENDRVVSLGQGMIGEGSAVEVQQEGK